MSKPKRHYERLDEPLCGAKGESLVLVDKRKHTTCERCKKAHARLTFEAFAEKGIVH